MQSCSTYYMQGAIFAKTISFLHYLFDSCYTLNFGLFCCFSLLRDRKKVAKSLDVQLEKQYFESHEQNFFLVFSDLTTLIDSQIYRHPWTFFVSLRRLNNLILTKKRMCRKLVVLANNAPMCNKQSISTFKFKYVIIGQLYHVNFCVGFIELLRTDPNYRKASLSKETKS